MTVSTAPGVARASSPFVSPSQIEDYRRCSRRWWFKYALKRPEPQVAQTREGIVIAEAIENYLKSTGPATPLVQSIVNLLPDPRKRLVVEEWVRFPASDFSHVPELDGVIMGGRVDVINLDDLEVLDVKSHKRTLQYAKSVRQLREDVQLAMYAYAQFRAGPLALTEPELTLGQINVVRPAKAPDEPDEVILTRPAPEAQPRTVPMAAAEIIEVVNRAALDVVEMRRLSVLEASAVNDVPFNPKACWAFGRLCPYAADCPKIDTRAPFEGLSLKGSTMTVHAPLPPPGFPPAPTVTSPPGFGVLPGFAPPTPAPSAPTTALPAPAAPATAFAPPSIPGFGQVNPPPMAPAAYAPVAPAPSPVRQDPNAPIGSIMGLDPKHAEKLAKAGCTTAQHLAHVTEEWLRRVAGFQARTLEKILPVAGRMRAAFGVATPDPISWLPAVTPDAAPTLGLPPAEPVLIRDIPPHPTTTVEGAMPAPPPISVPPPMAAITSAPTIDAAAPYVRPGGASHGFVLYVGCVPVGQPVVDVTTALDPVFRAVQAEKNVSFWGLLPYGEGSRLVANAIYAQPANLRALGAIYCPADFDGHILSALRHFATSTVISTAR